MTSYQIIIFHFTVSLFLCAHHDHGASLSSRHSTSLKQIKIHAGRYTVARPLTHYNEKCEMKFVQTLRREMLTEKCVFQMILHIANCRELKRVSLIIMGGSPGAFTYVKVHSPTLPPLYLRHSAFSNPSVASPTSQLILQIFFGFSYVTGYSLTSAGEPTMLIIQEARHLCHMTRRKEKSVKLLNLPSKYVSLFVIKSGFLKIYTWS